jgi:MGT family glycosyltransferase
MIELRRVLVALWDGGGTVPPELAVVRGLVERGHDVTVIGDAVLAAEVAATGAAHVPWTTAPQHATRRPEDDFVQDWEAKTPLQLFARVRDRFLTGPARHFADDVAAELRRRPADVLVSSSLLFGAQIGAEAAGVPVVLLSPNVYGLPGTDQPPLGTGWSPARGPLGRTRDRLFGRLMERMFDSGLAALNAARAAHGLAPLAHTLDQVRRHRTVVLIEAAFDFPMTPPPNVRYGGAQLDDPSWAAPWSPPPGDEPLVLVAMSSTYQAQLPDLQRIAAALGTLPVRGLITAGPALDPSALTVPPNVQVVASAPHSEVLRHAAAVVTHGGHGTVAKALAADVPLLVMPMGRDQGDNAARVVAHGAGLRLKRSARPSAIAGALRRVLEDPSFGAAAARLGSAVRAGSGPAVAIEEVEDAAQNGSDPAARADLVTVHPG